MEQQNLGLKHNGGRLEKHPTESSATLDFTMSYAYVCFTYAS